MYLNIFKTKPDVSDLRYTTNGAACFDISSYLGYQGSVKAFTKSNAVVELLATQNKEGKVYIEVPSEWRVLIPTGLMMDIPENYSVRIYPRSGLSTKKGLNLINSVGIIDSDYIDEVFDPLYNNSQEKLAIFSGERIAQGEMVRNRKVDFEYLTTRPIVKTNRTGGFGSTGIS